MDRRFKEARLLKGFTVMDCAEKLGVGKPTLSAWERGAKNPTLENLEAMADLYGVSVDYLLGRTAPDANSAAPISKDMLTAVHGRPVWSNELGWCIVDNINGCLCGVNGNIPLTDAYFIWHRTGLRNPPLSLNPFRRMNWTHLTKS